MLRKKCKIVYGKKFIRVVARYYVPCDRCKYKSGKNHSCSNINITENKSVYNLCARACNDAGYYNYMPGNVI